MLKILHTADWHLGYTSGQLDADDARKLARARLTVVEDILGQAKLYQVHCVLCAGDLFEASEPGEQWWRGLLDVFGRRRNWEIPVILLPGNHDPIKRNSVYSLGHPFRTELPEWVHVVDDADFEFEVPGHDAVIVGAPCTSTAGSHDLAMSLPEREAGDARIRIGLVHGSTWDLKDFDTNFPIDKHAPEKRGLDYLAIGDTHGFREVVPGAMAPTVYPGAPEQTRFAEEGAGNVAVVSFRNRGRKPRIHPVKVGSWRWEERTVRDTAQLHALLDEELDQTVLRLQLNFGATIEEHDRVEADLQLLKGNDAVCGRVGALVVDRSGLRLDVTGSELPEGLPDLLYEVLDDLESRSAGDSTVRSALVTLHRLVRESS